jgi:hypothetical protein
MLSSAENLVFEMGSCRTGPALRDMRRLGLGGYATLCFGSPTRSRSVMRLRGVEPPEWRLRVGDWRVRFQYDHPAQTIRVLRALPRGRAYPD